MSRTRSLAAVVAALLALPASAGAQTQTDTTPLGDYSQPGTTSTVETTPSTSGTAGDSTSGEPATTPSEGGGAPTQSGGGGEGSGAPAAAAETPSALAFTGFEAGIVALLGVALMGGAIVLQRRRRTS